MYISERSDMDHTVLHANTPCLPFLRRRSPDGATSSWGKGHPIAAYYSSIDPEEMKGWVGLVGWPVVDGVYPHNGHPSDTGWAQDRESSPAKDWRSITVPRNQPTKYCYMMSAGGGYSSSWFLSSLTDVGCTELLPHWPRPLCCKSTQVGYWASCDKCECGWSKQCLT